MSKPDQDLKLLPKPDPKSYLDAKKIMPDQQYCMNEQNTDISTSGIVLGLIHAYSKRLTEVSSNRKYLYIIKKRTKVEGSLFLCFLGQNQAECGGIFRCALCMRETPWQKLL
jgi:hypothetical protein